MLRTLERFRPDVLIRDIGMPDEDSHALVRHMREIEARQGRRIAAVALTAYARDDDRTRALSAGYPAHVAKPIEPIQLVALVASLAARAARQS